MSTLQITLSEELDRFVAAKVKDGTCADASEVVNSALRLLEREEREYDEKMVALKAAIQAGLDGGVAEPGVFERLDAYIDELADANEADGATSSKKEDEEQEYDEKMAALCAAIQVGLDSGVAEPGTFERIRQKYNLPQREACA